MALELKIPPVLVAILTAISMWIVKALLPLLSLDLPYRTMIASLIAAAGCAMSLWGVYNVKAAKTTVNPLKFDSVSSLVESGIYAYTRNPMYLGLLIILCAWFYYLSNYASACLLPIFILYMNHFQIRPEERVLESKFNEAFHRYKRNVRRWL